MMALVGAVERLKFTVSLALLLTSVAYLILNRTHLFKVFTLVGVAFSAAVPSAAYLVKTGVWTYAPEVTAGRTVLGVPIAELVFLFLQAYITSVFYILFNITLVHAKYLTTQRNSPAWISRTKRAGQISLVLLRSVGIILTKAGGQYTYIGLILTWAPLLAFVPWTVAGKFIRSLPLSATAGPILISTAYLILAEELVCGKGKWTIPDEKKLGFRLFGSLDIEDAIFFLLTNTIIVFGLAALDMYLAVIDAFPHLFPQSPPVPTPNMMLQAILTRTEEYDMDRVQGIREADDRLRAKSRSFHLASFAFSGRLRLDLVLLYSFCRMADDLIDEATSEAEITMWNSKLVRYLDYFYTGNGIHRPEAEIDRVGVKYLIESDFPASARSALKLLPTHILPGNPFYVLIEGFRMDAQFNIANKDNTVTFPINDESALWKYSNCVAGTIGQLLNALIVHHCEYSPSKHLHTQLGHTAMRMGIALQFVNIARDISTDAKMGRVYLPTSWLNDVGMTPEDVIRQPDGESIQRFRRRILDMAFTVYQEMRPCMEHLPREARGPMILIVESYMEIGRVLRESYTWTVEHGKATVPTRRRILMAVKALLAA